MNIKNQIDAVTNSLITAIDKIPGAGTYTAASSDDGSREVEYANTVSGRVVLATFAAATISLEQQGFETLGADDHAEFLQFRYAHTAPLTVEVTIRVPKYVSWAIRDNNTVDDQFKEFGYGITLEVK
jgi:hypothetical protein